MCTTQSSGRRKSQNGVVCSAVFHGENFNGSMKIVGQFSTGMKTKKTPKKTNAKRTNSLSTNKIRKNTHTGSCYWFPI